MQTLLGIAADACCFGPRAECNPALPLRDRGRGRMAGRRRGRNRVGNSDRAEGEEGGEGKGEEKAAGDRPRREGQGQPPTRQVSVIVWVQSSRSLMVPGLKSRIGFHLAGFSGLMRRRNAPRRGRSSDLPGLTAVGPAPCRGLACRSTRKLLSGFCIARLSTSPTATFPSVSHTCTARETALEDHIPTCFLSFLPPAN